MDALEAVLEARRLLDNVTPLRRDCGRVCGAACCAPDEDGQGGMLLLPGEEALYDPLPEGFRLSRDGGVLPGLTLLTCEGRCARGARPYACRVFPLTPVLTEKGELRVRVDPRAFAVCPLSEQGVRGMNPAFARAVLEGARVLCQFEPFRNYFEALNRYFARLRAWEGKQP